jgi:hypothetical protein
MRRLTHYCISASHTLTVRSPFESGFLNTPGIEFIYVLPDHSVGGKPGGIIQGGNNLFITFLRFDKTNRYFLTQLSTFCRNI